MRLDALQVLLEQANQALGRLDGLASVLPDLSLFIYAYVRKEAVLSSQIEGTQSSLSDLLLFENEEAPGVPLEDVQEVSNYVAALYHGLKRMREGFPLSLRLIREIHEVLLSHGRGSDKEPGEFRRSQNWIGGTRPGNAAFVPPPPDLVMECMSQLELFLHEENQELPLLIRAGLVHVQFETIHPFLDGNGRLGRLLITFLLCAGGALGAPSRLSVGSSIETPTEAAKFDTASIHEAWRKALDRIANDPDGAITAARTLLESVCKHLLDEINVEYGDNADLPKLYGLTAEELNLAPSQHTEDAFKKILGGAQSVVNGLANLRNRLGDAHGQGKRPVKPLPRHAELAVNMAGSMASFLLATFEAKGV